MRFKRGISALMSLSLLFASGCKTNAPVENKPKDDIEGKLVIWTNNETRNIIDTSRLAYLALHQKAEIEVINVNSDEIKNKLNTAVQANSGLPDIICIEDERAQSAIKDFQGILEDTGDDIKKDNYLRYKTDNLTREGKLYGIPLNTKPGVLVARIDYFQQSNVNPEYIKTWDDLIASGKNVMKTTGKPMIAFTMENDNLYRGFLNQLGGSYFSKENKPLLNSDKAIRAADMMKRLNASGVVKMAASSSDIVKEFKAGNICTAVMSPEELDSITKSNPELKGKLLISKLPAYEEGGNQAISLNGSSMLLISGSKSKKLMVDFSKFITENRDNVKVLMKSCGSLTAYTGFYDEKWFSSVDEYFSGQERWKLLSYVAEDIYGVNYTENYLKIKQTVSETAANIVLRGADSKVTLEQLQTKVLDILKQNNTEQK